VVPPVDCAAGNCLPIAEAPWFPIAMAAVWAAVLGLAACWGAVCWREHRQCRPRAAHRPPRGPRLRSAVTVQELQRRLTTEAAEAAQLPRPVRDIEVIHRRVVHRAPPPLGRLASPDTHPFDPFGPDSEDDS
jgi:hypothetical protein